MSKTTGVALVIGLNLFSQVFGIPTIDPATSGRECSFKTLFTDDGNYGPCRIGTSAGSNGQEFTKLGGKNITECEAECIKDDNCVAFEARRTYTGCELWHTVPDQVKTFRPQHACKIKVSDPCMNGGTCSNNIGTNSYMCTCPAGFSGPNCETNIDECAPNPCQNGGSCTDGIDSYTCSCPAGYVGVNCETNFDDCAANPCQNGGSCTDGIDSYTCSCPAGYVGINCETNFDDCAANPCQNGGSCTDGIDAYSCSCLTGYSGPNCETNIDECASNPCQNGGSCTDGINSYTCSCPAGYSGPNCETNINECAPNPCQNGGSCIDGIDSYTCSCPVGYSGLNCETNINECDPNPCQNGGSCVDGINSFTCNCINGYVGSTCGTSPPPPPPPVCNTNDHDWVLSQSGQSCTHACSNVGKSCNVQPMKDIPQFGVPFAYNLATGSNCNDSGIGRVGYGPGRFPNNNICFQSGGGATCGARNTQYNVQRICCCGSNCPWSACN
eukprot:Awhi_evm1s523